MSPIPDYGKGISVVAVVVVVLVVKGVNHATGLLNTYHYSLSSFAFDVNQVPHS